MAPPETPINRPPARAFARRFGAAPFSVLNAREGWWQKRKKQWIDLGIESEQGRPKDLIYSASANAFLTKEGKQALLQGRTNDKR